MKVWCLKLEASLRQDVHFDDDWPFASHPLIVCHSISLLCSGSGAEALATVVNTLNSLKEMDTLTWHILMHTTIIKNVVWIQPFIRGMYNSNRSTNNEFVVGTPCKWKTSSNFSEKVDTNSPVYQMLLTMALSFPWWYPAQGGPRCHGV